MENQVAEERRLAIHSQVLVQTAEVIPPPNAPIFILFVSHAAAACAQAAPESMRRCAAARRLVPLIHPLTKKPNGRLITESPSLDRAMKTSSRFAWKSRFFGCLGVVLSATLAGAESPIIESIQVRDTHLVVSAHVPEGIVRVILESRERLREGAWTPVAVQRLDGLGGRVHFQLRRTAAAAVLRVRADATEPLPASFYAGTNVFLAEADWSANTELLGGYRDGTGGTPSSSPTREVAESDIWRLDGDTLYFFNQYRGLQVIDVTNPDAATLRGTLNLPAAGEQMYLLPSNHVALLIQGRCGGYGLEGEDTDGGRVLIVAVRNGVPSVVTNLPVAGMIAESRLVGTALYVASQTASTSTNNGGTTWEWGTQITSFDLAVPETPVTRSKLWYAGYGHVIHATDTYLFVVTRAPANWQQSIVQIVDITAPDGTMRAYATLTPAGSVADKFKLDWTDGVFSVISEVSGTPRVTKLETFRLPDPRTAPPFAFLNLGEVELGHGERLYATRFDYPRAYVVTFLQIDPLWIVDLSDPIQPKVSGELEVPGWSTYIQPRGDQLVAVGVETNRTTVSLFDVTAPSRPALLSRVQLGSKYSHSEANQDEKAFNVLEDAGLILLPLQGYTTNGYESWVQLIDLGTHTLTVRGRIEHKLAPRRATLHRNRVVSVSGVELLSVDATDRDRPQLTGQLDLGWPVNRVLLASDFLLELTTGESWDGQTQPMVRVATVLNPDMVLAILPLTNTPIVGATALSNRLYLLQGDSVGGFVVPKDGTDSPPSNALWLTIVDLSNLPALTMLGQTGVVTSPLGWNAEVVPLWLKPGLLVWVGGGITYYGWGPWEVAPRDGLLGGDGGFWPYTSSGSGGRLFAFDVSDGAAPAWVSEVDLTTNGWFDFSRPFAADGRVYLSHRAYVDFTTNSSTVSTEPLDPAFGGIVCWPTPYQRAFLDVVDYADAPHPTVRPPVSLPGTLQGISHGGDLLYTIGFHRTSTNFYEGAEALDASAYDGVSAHLVDSLSLSNSWPHPALVCGTNVFLGRAPAYFDVESPMPPTLETWTLSSTGRFTKLGAVALPIPASDLVAFPGLLAAQLDYIRARVFDPSDPATLRQVGDGPMAGCSYFNLRHADATPASGLWLPLDALGVTGISLLK